MKSRHVVIAMAVFALAGCATNANGPSFAAVSHAPQPEAENICIFRDKVAYVVQADHVAKPAVMVDDRLAGRLANGGFLLVDVPAGRHILTIGDPGDTTVVSVDATPGTSIYLETWDKTRMQGAKVAAAGLTSGAIGGAVAGVLIGLSTTPTEGRTWHTEQEAQEQALPVLQSLRRSD